MRYGVLLGLILIISIASPAKGQTAEETVAFILLGVEDGANAPPLAENGSEAPRKWDKMGAVGQFSAERVRPNGQGKESRICLSVRRYSDCLYILVVSMAIASSCDAMDRASSKKSQIVVRAEFDQISSIAYQKSDGKRLIKGAPKGLCEHVTEVLVGEQTGSALDKSRSKVGDKLCYPDKANVFPSLLASIVARPSKGMETDAEAMEARFGRAVDYFKSVCRKMRPF